MYNKVQTNIKRLYDLSFDNTLKGVAKYQQLVMIETTDKCKGCGKILEDHFDECCEQGYEVMYRCNCCGEWVEELVEGEEECHSCYEQRTPVMTWSQFYNRSRVYPTE